MTPIIFPVSMGTVQTKEALKAAPQVFKKAAPPPPYTSVAKSSSVSVVKLKQPVLLSFSLAAPRRQKDIP